MNTEPNATSPPGAAREDAPPERRRRRSSARLAMLARVGEMLPAKRRLSRKRYDSGHADGSLDGENAPAPDAASRRASVPPTAGRDFLLLDPEDVRNRGHSEGSFPWDDDSQAGRQPLPEDDANLPPPPPPPSESPDSSLAQDEDDEAEKQQALAAAGGGFVILDNGAPPETAPQEPPARTEPDPGQGFVIMQDRGAKPRTLSQGSSDPVPTPSDPVSADVLAARIGNLEEQLEKHARATVRAIADAAGQDPNAYTATEVSSLTPTQIALLYKTLQCGDVSPRRVVKSDQVPAQLAETPRLAHPMQSLRSETLQLDAVRGFKLDGLRATDLYSRPATSAEIKQQFWNTRAARIQAAWRGYRTRREILAAMNAHVRLLATTHSGPALGLVSTVPQQATGERHGAFDALAQLRVTRINSQDPHSSLAELPSMSPTASLSAADRAWPGPVPIGGIPFGTRGAAADVGAVLAVQIPGKAAETSSMGSSAARAELHKAIPRRESRSEEDGETGRSASVMAPSGAGVSQGPPPTAEQALHLYKVLRGRSKAPLTVSSVVSKLRRSRSGVRKTPFDLLLDQCVKALLRRPSSQQYATLLPSDFVSLVESTPCMQELADKLESMAKEGRVLFVREPASKAQPLSVTAQESQLLHGLYKRFAGDVAVVRARPFAEALHHEAGLAAEVANLLVAFARSPKAQQFAHLGPSDLVAFVEDQTARFSNTRHANPGEVLLALAATVKRAADEMMDGVHGDLDRGFRSPPTAAPPPSLLPPQFPFASLKEAAKYHASRYI